MRLFTTLVAFLGSLGLLMNTVDASRNLRAHKHHHKHPNPNKGKYDIELIVLKPLGKAVLGIFDDAVKRWESIITKDLPNTVTYPAGMSCFGYSDTILEQDKVIDDLLIFLDVYLIDGVGGILGQAGPCVVTQDAITGKSFSRVGYLALDSADVNAMAGVGILESVVLHEITHILGFGTLWSTYGLVDSSVTPPQYKGVNGIIGLDKVGGTGDPIVEDTGAPGTVGSHWKKTVYGDELMTGYINSVGPAPLSKMTIDSLMDMGLITNDKLADQYSVPPPGQSGSLRNPNKDRNYTEDFVMHGDIVLENFIILNSTSYETS